MRQLDRPGYRKEKVPTFRPVLNIEQCNDLWKVFEERIRELLGIAKREFHDLLVDLVKRKRQSIEEPRVMKVNTNAVLIDDTTVEDELPDTHYTKLH